MITKALVALLVLMAMAAVTFAASKQPISDDAIYDNVRRRLANDAVVKGAGLNVDVKGGIVTLRGKVEVEQQKARATKLAKKVKGVKGVENQLTVVGKGGR